MTECSVHGFSPLFIYSPALLELEGNGTLPDVVVVEVRDADQYDASFYLNLTPAEAAALPIIDGRIPFDMEATGVIARLPVMCGICFYEQRRAVLEHARRAGPSGIADPAS